MQEFRAGIWRQELERNWRTAGYRFAPHGLFSGLSYTYFLGLPAQASSTHSLLCPLNPSLRKYCTDVSTGQDDRYNPSNEVPSSQGTLCSIKVTITSPEGKGERRSVKKEGRRGEGRRGGKSRTEEESGREMSVAPQRKAEITCEAVVLGTYPPLSSHLLLTLTSS